MFYKNLLSMKFTITTGIQACVKNAVRSCQTVQQKGCDVGVQCQLNDAPPLVCTGEIQTSEHFKKTVSAVKMRKRTWRKIMIQIGNLTGTVVTSSYLPTSTSTMFL